MRERRRSSVVSRSSFAVPSFAICRSPVRKSNATLFRTLESAFPTRVPFWDAGVELGYPPTPIRSFRIKTLAPDSFQSLERVGVRGKVLRAKELGLLLSRRLFFRDLLHKLSKAEQLRCAEHLHLL